MRNETKMKTQYDLKEIFNQKGDFVQIQIILKETEFCLPLETLLRKGINSFHQMIESTEDQMELYCRLIIDIWTQYEYVCSKIIREDNLQPTPLLDFRAMRRPHINRQDFRKQSQELRSLYRKMNLQENEVVASLCDWAHQKYKIKVQYFRHGEIQITDNITEIEISEHRNELLEPSYYLRLKTEAFRMMIKRANHFQWSSPVTLMSCFKHQMDAIENTIQTYLRDYESGANLLFMLTEDFHQGFKNG